MARGQWAAGRAQPGRQRAARTEHGSRRRRRLKRAPAPHRRGVSGALRAPAGGAERAAGAGVAARCRRRAVGAVTANPRLSARLGRAAAPRPAGRDRLRPLPLVWLTEIAATVRGSVAAP